MGGGQLILTGRTLRVLAAVLPYGPLATSMTKARDPYRGAIMRTTKVRDLLRAISAATCDQARVITSEALLGADAELRHRVATLDLNGLELAGRHYVSVFVWDLRRDGPAPAHDQRAEATGH